MIKLIRKYFETGIKAHEIIMESHKSSMEHLKAQKEITRLYKINLDNQINWHNFQAENNKIHNDIVLDKLLKKIGKTTEDEIEIEFLKSIKLK